jgi:2-polyprenyl-3-methyl-5-hydroxy-6-metoxy-1,4-benzoquinol methylase
MRVGVDPQPKAKEFAVDGVNVITGTMKDVHNKFDVVMSWHVIEHVDNPVEFIQDMVDHTFIGGVVIIATPNADSIKAKSHKWRCLEPFHKYLLGKKLLRQMMRDSGLCIIAEMTWGGFPAPRSWWQNIGNRVLKWVGQGDVQLIVARKSIDK